MEERPPVTGVVEVKADSAWKLVRLDVGPDLYDIFWLLLTVKYRI